MMDHALAACYGESSRLTDLVPVPRVVGVDDRGRGGPQSPVDLLVQLAHLGDRAHPKVEEDVLKEALLLVIQLWERDDRLLLIY